MSLVDLIRERIHKRKRNRERKRRLKQGGRARREGRAIRRLRVALAAAAAPRKMYDAVDVQNIPKRARAVAGYVNGNYMTYGQLILGWPKARKVAIAVSSPVDADCLDVEPGDATNADAAAWFHRHRGGKPIFYTSASNADALVAALKAAGIKRPAYKLWTAHYAGKHICGPRSCGEVRSTTADATQWTTHNETLDESKVKLSFWRTK